MTKELYTRVMYGTIGVVGLIGHAGGYFEYENIVVAMLGLILFTLLFVDGEE